MDSIKSIETKVDQAYKQLKNKKTQESCDVFLSAWDDLKNLMQQNTLNTLDELQAAYPWSDFVTNWVQDIEQELEHAGRDNPVYHSKRIKYCKELLERAGDSDTLMKENTRRAIADSFFALGNATECDRLYQAWLDKDPAWGWGHIGWSDCYHFGMENIAVDQKKAERIISLALEVKDLRDRADVVDRAIEIYQDLDDVQRANELKAELVLLTTDESISLAPNPAQVHSAHIGRNDPCPCGSGKKYKKCCGK